MRRVIQRTVRTTKIVSLTITHSESEEAVEYTLTSADLFSAPTGLEQTEQPAQLENPAELAADRSDPNPTDLRGEHDELNAQFP